MKDGPIVALDVENESAVQEASSRLVRNKTVLIIAHRMRTVAGADQVVVLDGDTVAQQGTPDELMARDACTGKWFCDRRMDARDPP